MGVGRVLPPGGRGAWVRRRSASGRWVAGFLGGCEINLAQSRRLCGAVICLYESYNSVIFAFILLSKLSKNNSEFMYS